MIETERKCKTCGKVKPIEAFKVMGVIYPDRPRYRTRECLECIKRKRRGKVCPGCGVHKGRKHFSKNRGRKDGLQVYCMTCMTQRVDQWRCENYAIYRKQDNRLARKYRASRKAS